MSHFYHEYGRSVLGGDIIGSIMRGPNCHSSSVVTVFWPGSCNSLSAIDYTQKRVGVIQFFLTNTFELSFEDGATQKLEYVCLCTVDEKVP